MLLEEAEVSRLEKIRLELESAVDYIEKRLHADFSELVEKSSVTLKGREIFEAVSSGNELRYVLERGLKKDYRLLVKNAVEELSKRLMLTPEEAQFIENMFPEDVTYPLSINREQVDELKKHTLKQLSSRKFKAAQNHAKKLYKYHDTVERLVKELIDFDTMYSVACFARTYNLAMPTLTEHIGLSIRGGVNLFIGKNAVPVDYAVGDVPESPKHAKRILLSGVNSGGKTTILDLLAQIVILSHMGFPVPAQSVSVGLVDELFYFGKSKGSLGAGAFEATIKSFSDIPSDTRKIVLADELEAITEPGASARIIGGVLEAASTNSLLVFVSHLAELILEHATCEVRVDGIEASGLDERMNLIVERTPRYNYLAKSTPQLIVERLSKIEKTHAEFYQHLLCKFKE
jgi:dsDNA-specific endonuclease/ATPase MutS2